MHREEIIVIMKKHLILHTNEILKRDYLIFATTRRIINSFEKTGKININLLFNNVIICINKYDKDAYNIFKLLLTEEKLNVINPIFMFLGFLEGEHSMNEFVVEFIKDFAVENFIQSHFLEKL
jgi:hypothetical protein